MKKNFYFKEALVVLAVVIIFSVLTVFVMPAKAFPYQFGGWIVYIAPSSICNNPVTAAACGPCAGPYAMVVLKISGASQGFFCAPIYLEPFLRPGMEIIGAGLSPLPPHIYGFSY